ncbi:MAG: hypothetical protein GF313_00825 [Caldithrix sp.]|nr:hypothetical protein [Caldithrix sp.]
MIRFLIYITFAALFMVVFGGCQQNHPALDGEHIAVVGNDGIIQSDFERRLGDFLKTTGMDDNLQVRRQILNNMIHEVLLKDYDNNDAIINDESYQKRLEWNRRQTILAYLKDREIYQNIQVTEEDLRTAFYRLNQKVTARHLYAPSREKAHRLYERLQNGETFASLAKEVYSDAKLRDSGGYLGQFSWGDMDRNFEEKAFSIPVGEISQPVKTEQGYSIIKVESRKTHPIITESEYQNRKEKLRQAVRINKKHVAERDFMDLVFQEQDLSFNKEALHQCLRMMRSGFKEEMEEAGSSTVINNDCLTYKGDSWSIRQALHKLDDIPDFHLNKINDTQALQDALTGLVQQNQLLQLAEEKGYDKVPQVQEKIQKARHITFYKFKRNAIADKKIIPDSALQTFYNEHINQFMTEDELSIQEIVVDERGQAEDLLHQLQRGQPFDKLARNHSLRQWSAKRDGHIGYSPVSKFGNLQDTLWNTAVGKTIGPIAFDRYFGVFKILGKKESRPYPLNKVREEVANTMRRTLEKQYVSQYLDSLRSEVTIKIDESLLKNIQLSSFN